MGSFKYTKLKIFFLERGILHKNVAEFLGINQATFSNKINLKNTDFTMEEMRKICKRYELNSSDYFM